MEPKYYERRRTWLIYLNDREVLYDDTNTLIEFDTEAEALDYIHELCHLTHKE